MQWERGLEPPSRRQLAAANYQTRFGAIPTRSGCQYSLEDLDDGRARGPLPGSRWIIPQMLLIGPFPAWTEETEQPSTAVLPMAAAGGRKSPMAGPISVGQASLSDRDEALELLMDVAHVNSFFSVQPVSEVNSNRVLFDYQAALRALCIQNAERQEHGPASFTWLPLQVNTNYDDEFVSCFVNDALERLIARKETLYLHCSDGRERAPAFAAVICSIFFNLDADEAMEYVLRCEVSAASADLVKTEKRGGTAFTNSSQRETATSGNDGETERANGFLATDGGSLHSTELRPSLGPTTIDSSLLANQNGPSRGTRPLKPSAISSDDLRAMDRTNKLWKQQAVRLMQNKAQRFQHLIQALHPAPDGTAAERRRSSAMASPTPSWTEDD